MAETERLRGTKVWVPTPGHLATGQFSDNLNDHLNVYVWLVGQWCTAAG